MEYTKRQAVAANPVQVPVPQLDLSQFKPVPNVQAGTDWDKGVMTPPAKRSQIDEFLDAPTQANTENQRHLAAMAISREDYANAAQIYGALASQGDAFSQAKLGYMYANGQGVVQDNVRAHMWSNLSAGAGYALAATNRKTFAMQMTPQQIAQAEQMARDCQQRNFKGCN